MKSASAMKYGGELVDAVDCDYDSFKELIPLCPNCKEPVFLRTGGQRESAKGKAYQIGPHWCHFKGISKEQVAGCELRVNGYTEKDRAKIANQARGQRLKLLQRWFWNVFVKTHKSMGFPVAEIIATQKPHFQSLVGSSGYSIIENVVWVITETTPPPINSKQMFFNIAEAVSQNKIFVTTGNVSISNAIQKAFIERYSRDTFFLSKMSGYACESWAFLHSRQNRAMLEDLVVIAIYNVFDTVMDGVDYGFSVPSNRIANRVGGGKYEVLFLFETVKDLWLLGRLVSEAIGVWLSTIPWASEFQRLETEAKQRKGAA